MRTVDGSPWYRVWLPAPPNGTQGWVPDEQLAFYTTTSKIEIDLSERQLTVVRRGAVQGTWPVAVGRPGLETPTGTFFVTLKLRPPDPGGAYGVLALGHQRLPGSAERLGRRRHRRHPRDQRAVAHRQGRSATAACA